MNKKLSKKELLRIMSKRFKKDPGKIDSQEEEQQPVRDTEDSSSFLRELQQLDALLDDAIKSHGPNR